MFNPYRVAAAIVLAASGHAAAQPTVQERMSVMDAQLELLKREGQLTKALQESVGSSWAALPQVLAVMGLDGVMVTRLQLANGVVNSYRVGELVRPGMTVASIAPRQVWIRVGGPKGSRAVPLEFIAGAPAAGQATGFAPLPGGRPPVPRELLPEPPSVRLPAVAMPTTAPPVPAPVPAAAPAAAAAAAATAPVVASPGAATAIRPTALNR